MIIFPEAIKDAELELRRIKPTFKLAKTVFEIVDRNREGFRRWLPWVDQTNTIEDQYDGMVRIYIKEWNYWIFYNGKLSGDVSFVKIKEKGKALTIGYWLDKAAGGRGIMTRSVALLEKAAFCTGDAWNRIEICCDVLNEKSQSVPQRLGYVHEGTMRRYFPYNDGTFGDIMMFSKLKSEWQGGRMSCC